MDQPKVERMLRLMKLMAGNTSLSVDDLAQRLDTNCRSIYRYIDTFKEAGFVVRKMAPGVYQLVSMDSRMTDLSKVVYFSDEEAAIVGGLIEGLDNTNSLKRNLHRKLASIYESAPVTDFTGKSANAQNVRELSDAIRRRRQAVLHSYKSSHSGVARDRKVEPFEFTTNYIHVWCYDLEDGKCKMFGVSRIAEVEVLDDFWDHIAEHHTEPVDIFRMPGRNRTHVALKLGTMSKNLLLEEYPLAEKQLRQQDGGWILETDVFSMKGVGRFVIGLADDIEVLDSPELAAYIKEFSAKYLL